VAWVTPEFIDTWRTGEHVGADRPAAVVQVQRGSWERGWHTWTGPPVRAALWGENSYGDSTAQPGNWYPIWVPASAWVDIPNIYSIKRTKGFDQNGAAVLELVIDALDYINKTGALGDAYHVIQPGFLAPDRGAPILSEQPDPGWASSQWTNFITDGVKVRVWQGLGEPQTDVDGNQPPINGGPNGAWTFAGQIDDVDIDADPNQITITARSGKMLTDQHLFGWAKSKRIPDPVQFYDTLSATQLRMVGKSPAASSSMTGLGPEGVIDLPADPWNTSDPAYLTAWQSGAAISSTHLEWVDIRLPQGTYDECWLNSLAGMSAYVGIFAHSIVHHTKQPDGTITTTTVPPRIDGTNLPVGWVDLGYGNAPGGTYGGWPWIRSFRTGQNPSPPALPNIDRVHFNHEFDLGERSVLRLGFIDPTNTIGHAEVFDLHGFQRTLIDDVEDARFILVPDASEIVKVVLRWAGYHEWEVEEAGVRISDGTTYNAGITGVMKQSGKLVFERAKFLIDPIQEVAKQLGFVFFIADPIDANSDGIPTFRRDSSLLVDNNYLAADLRDTDMLTGLKRKATDSNRPFIIRVRGRTTDQYIPGSVPTGTAANPADGGLPLGGDRIRRIMAVYVPPWAPADPYGGPYKENTAGIVRHIIYQDDQLITYAMCLMGCFLIALQAALSMYTATVEIPALPLVELDDQVRVRDTPTATNSRLWVTSITDTMTLGDGGVGGSAGASSANEGLWKMSLSGALQDTADFWGVMRQALGVDPISVNYSDGPRNVYLNWSRIYDPVNGMYSSYMPPYIQGVARSGRLR
jgi:hypothetical protein